MRRDHSKHSIILIDLSITPQEAYTLNKPFGDKRICCKQIKTALSDLTTALYSRRSNEMYMYKMMHMEIVTLGLEVLL